MAARPWGPLVGLNGAPPQVRSKATTLLLPFPTNRTVLSGLRTSPSGADSGFTPFAREAQHCAPGNPPNRPFGPNPGIPEVAHEMAGLAPAGTVLHPNLVNLPNAPTIGVMRGAPVTGSPAQTLAWSPAPATPVAPVMMPTA